METKHADVLGENFRECLRIYEQSIIWATLAAFASLLISYRMQSMAWGEIMKTRVQLLFTDVNLPLAWLLGTVVYVIVSSHGCFAAGRAHSICVALQDHPELLHALSQYPSLATSENSFLRLVGVFVPPIFILWSWIVEMIREGAKSWQDWIGGGGLVLLLLVVPYLFLFEYLKKPLGSAPKEAAPAA